MSMQTMQDNFSKVLTREDTLDVLTSESILPRLGQQFRECLGKKGAARFYNKCDGSVSSDFEVRVETQIGEFLALATPWANVRGEEGFQYASVLKSSPYTWYIDPIDGSISFQNRLDSYSFVATLAEGDSAIAAIVLFPQLGREYHALAGRGLWCEGQRIQTRPPSDEKAVILATSDDYTYDLVGRKGLLSLVHGSVFTVRTYTDLYGHSLVAHGSCGIKFDAACARWDRLPAELMARESGVSTRFLPVSHPEDDLEGSLIVYHPSLESHVNSLLAEFTSLGGA